MTRSSAANQPPSTEVDTIMTDTPTDDENSPPTESLGTVDVTADRVQQAFGETDAENFTDFALNYCEIGSERVEVDGE